MSTVRVNCEALNELARQLDAVREEIDTQGEQLTEWGPTLGHRRVIDSLEDFAENWGKARATISTSLGALSAMASGCATFYQEREAALASNIAAAGEALGALPPPGTSASSTRP